MSVLADKPTHGFRLLMIRVPPQLFCSYEFRKREIPICCGFFQTPFLQHVLRARCLLRVFCRQQGALLVGCKHSSGGRERALLKPSSERPWRTKPLSGSLSISLSLCSRSLWIFNALPSFINESFHLLAVLGRWFAVGGGRMGAVRGGRQDGE